MQAHLRELLPAPSRSSNTPPAESAETENVKPQDKRKRELIKIACRVCQRRRVKCSGLRPSCASCNKRGDVCVYDFNVSPDTTRYQALRKRQLELEQFCTQTAELLELIRQRPRFEAMAIFEQIRKGDSLEELLSSVRDGEMLIGLSSPPSRDLPHEPTTESIRSEGMILPPLRMAVKSVQFQHP